MIVKLENWAFEACSSPWTAPEAVRLRLTGVCKGHHRKPDGSRIVTSKVEQIHHSTRLVRTASGTVYRLGKVSAEYAAWALVHAPEHEALVLG